MNHHLLLWLPVAAPAVAAAGHAAAGWRRTLWAGPIVAAVILAAGGALAAGTRSGPVTAGPLRGDALAALLLIVIGAVALVATATSPSYLRAEHAAGHLAGNAGTRYSALVQAFLATMCLAVLAGNLGVTWVAVEATTISTAFLVGHKATRPAIEAAWKYTVICSVGIALAFLGVVILHYAAQHSTPIPANPLGWTDLNAAAANLDPAVTRIAVVLLILGFGTKAGLAPLHAWLPDAHSQAPAPVSALMSGVLLSVALGTILRVKVIADAALGIGFTRILLAGIALASLGVAASLLLAQRDYKRMLAYSSIEHLALMAFGAAIGTPLAIAAVLLHILGHGLAKSVLFCGAGHLLEATGSSHISAVRALAARAPTLAGLFAAGLLALIGLPPFALFASELGIAHAGFNAGLGWPTVAVLFLLVIIAAALLTHTGRMLLGPPPHTTDSHPSRQADSAAVRLRHGAAIPLVAGLAACAVLGVATGPLTQLLTAAATVVGTR
jgi:hydrogenase-4 component F